MVSVETPSRDIELDVGGPTVLAPCCRLTGQSKNEIAPRHLRSGCHSCALEKRSQRRELLGVRERVVSRTLELVMLAVDDELIDAVSLVMHGADVLDQMKQIRPLDVGRGVVMAKDRYQRLLMLRTQVTVRGHGVGY
jgi:hypothetical protein